MGSSCESDGGEPNSRWPAQLPVEEVDHSLLKSLLVNLLLAAEVFVEVVPFLIHCSIVCREYFPVLGGKDDFFDETGSQA